MALGYFLRQGLYESMVKDMKALRTEFLQLAPLSVAADEREKEVKALRKEVWAMKKALVELNKTSKVLGLVLPPRTYCTSCITAHPTKHHITITTHAHTLASPRESGVGVTRSASEQRQRRRCVSTSGRRRIN